MLVFPTRLFRPGSLRARLVGGAVTGGVSLGGTSQYAETSGGGLWAIEFGESTLWRRESFMAWQALEAALTNGATPIIVPLADRLHQPVNPQLTTTPFSDLSLWDDTVAWDQAEVAAVLTSPAALRATTLTFDYSAPRDLVGGEHLSALHAGNVGWRMYRVIEVVAQGGGSATVKIRPPLRGALAVDTPLNFDSPRCVCRVNGDVSALLELLRFGKGQASFIECFPESLD